MIEPLAWCGRLAEAEELVSKILASSPGADVEFATLRGLSAVYGNGGNIAGSIDAMRRAMASSGPRSRLEMFEFGPNLARGAPTHVERAAGLSQKAGHLQTSARWLFRPPASALGGRLAFRWTTSRAWSVSRAGLVHATC